MTKNFSTLIMAAVCCMFLFSNCSKDDEGPDTNMSPDENKQKLEDVGLELLGKINPEDHKELLQTLDAFMELADEGDLDIVIADFAGSFVKTVGQVASGNDLGALVGYNSTKAEIYQAKDYYGVYTWNEDEEEWDYEESISELKFEFPANGKNAVISLKTSGTEVDVKVDGNTIMVPPAAEGVITRDGSQLCKASMTNTVNNSANTVKLNATLTLNGGGDYVFNVVTDMTEQLATAEFSMVKGRETLISGNCKVTGQSMTNASVIEDTEDLEDLFKTAEGYVEILGQVNVRANSKDVKSLVKKLNDVDYDYKDEKTYQEEYAKILNEDIDAAMYYNGSNDVIAWIQFQPYMESNNSSWGGYDYWEIEPILVFRVDDSKHTFVNYFGKNNFSDLIKAFEKLADQYESFLD